MAHILAIDVGTSSSRGILYDEAGRQLFEHQVEYLVNFPGENLVEQDPADFDNAVAEICAASILNQIGIETVHSFRNSASYIDNWLKAIRGDNKLIVSAAGRAEKAAALILGSNHQEGGDGQCLA